MKSFKYQVLSKSCPRPNMFLLSVYLQQESVSSKTVQSWFSVFAAVITSVVQSSPLLVILYDPQVVVELFVGPVQDGDSTMNTHVKDP